ncbi:cysteinyl-tRNA synthetase [Halanaerobacter jeridensis]|uniref:Cysteine--tRNA ligase n=1 Tax=Halanaerobacter jeridensis TaxID=706427 RepID=A0A938XW02_9FIRM|nr:cysteine--tRNA ligase [Halanaerobacter jeridensis]MBM7557854.1 cysteinyl-tRNA synthetase [Halanaerobacter jeridensis]
MTLKIYNTLKDTKEEFETLEDGKVKMYSCGPTVYDYFHIGNARAFIVPDIVKRYLEYKGYEVMHVLNFTDIDDKMIKRANEEGITVDELAEKFITAYFEDTDALNIKRADVYPQATEHISEMINLVKTLIDKGYAYEKNGDVYFRVDKFDEYGKLSNKKIEDLQAGSRVDVNEEKEDPLDFTLWKESKAGEPEWDSPWGQGRPGWHIECSVMSTKYLGEEFDIHTGGVDLTFPHHENEIAQSEACCGHEVVNYWLHNGYINIEGEKMSKSLGNFFTTRDILDKYPAEVVRFFLISKHYRSPINFSEENMKDAAKSLERLENTVDRVKYLLKQDVQDGELKGAELFELVAEKKEDFIAAMDDDFNTSLAIASLHELAREVNKFIDQDDFVLTIDVKKALEKVKETFEELGIEVLGILKTTEETENDLVPDLVELLLETRSDLRDQGNYEMADQIRDELSNLGVAVKDTPQGAEWKIKE